MTEAERLKAIVDIIERVDDRCLAADGPVPKTRRQIKDEEIVRIYRLAKGYAAAGPKVKGKR